MESWKKDLKNPYLHYFSLFQHQLIQFIQGKEQLIEQNCCQNFTNNKN